MKKKDEVEKFINEFLPDYDLSRIMDKFTKYCNWLIKENEKINLISRKTDPEDLWTHHFLDSLMSIKCVNYEKKRILDFGTGGGFPGIPLAIVYGDSHFVLLDSTKKKIQSLRNGASVLKLTNCDFLDIRLEDILKNQYYTFDIVISRSVRISPEFKKTILNILKDDGLIVLYKSQNLDDAALFKRVEIVNVSTPLIGERKIVLIRKSDCD